MSEKLIRLIGGGAGTALSATGTALQTNDVLQTISLIITILGGLITFIIIPLYNWYKKSKKDGRITKEEIDEGLDTLVEGINDFKESQKGEKK